MTARGSARLPGLSPRFCYARRAVLAGGAGMLALGLVAPRLRASSSAVLPIVDDEALAALERRAGGRLGVAFLDDKGRLAGRRMNERFLFCSTFKLSLAAAVLARIDAGTLSGSALVRITPRDVVANSPVVTKALPGGAISILTLAEAAQVDSDNAAANLLLREIGGPEALTRFWRSLGDDESRLDRVEPALNRPEAQDDMRDTTTPTAMARSLAAILGAETLSAGSRQRLTRWMAATRTGAMRLRVGLPQSWRAGDKTGTYHDPADPAARINDIAAVWRPDGSAFYVTAYYEAPSATPLSESEAVLAEVGRIAAGWMTA